jgi:thiol-disulfide isomerase/thioredoxin
MKKLITICLLIATALTVDAQKTFSSKAEALGFLKETFSANFVKTAVNCKYSYDGKSFTSDNNYFGYEITDEYLKINEKRENKEGDDFVQVIMRFEDILYVKFVEKSIYFKNTLGIEFTSKYEGIFEGTRTSRGKTSSSYNSFPFNNANDIEVYRSIKNAFNTIVKENEKVTTENKSLNAESEPKKLSLLIKQNANEYSVLPNYKVYTEDGTQKALPDYILNNRRFKDKPTLVMTWGYWCNPCIKKIDEMLKADLAKKYNIFLINRDLESQLSTEVFKLKWSKNSQSYTSDAIVLFDRNGEFAPMDNNSAPVFIWLDKNLKMVGLYKSYAITTELIGETLLEVEKN